MNSRCKNSGPGDPISAYASSKIFSFSLKNFFSPASKIPFKIAKISLICKSLSFKPFKKIVSVKLFSQSAFETKFGIYLGFISSKTFKAVSAISG